MEISTKVLIKMVQDILQGKVIPQEDLAKLTTKCANLYNVKRNELPQIIKDVECEVTFELELGTPINE